MNNTKIVNVVAMTNLGRSLDLFSISKEFKDAEYDKKKFPGLKYRINEPKTAFLVFKNGKVVCTGAKSKKEARKAINIISKKLREVGADIEKNPEIKIVNIVAIHELGRQMNMNKLAIILGMENIEYEPEQFPGMVYRIKGMKVVLLIFSSGSVVCTGAKNKEEIEIAIQKLITELERSDIYNNI